MEKNLPSRKPELCVVLVRGTGVVEPTGYSEGGGPCRTLLLRVGRLENDLDFLKPRLVQSPKATFVRWPFLHMGYAPLTLLITTNNTIAITVLRASASVNR